MRLWAVGGGSAIGRMPAATPSRPVQLSRARGVCKNKGLVLPLHVPDHWSPVLHSWQQQTWKLAAAANDSEPGDEEDDFGFDEGALKELMGGALGDEQAGRILDQYDAQMLEDLEPERVAEFFDASGIADLPDDAGGREVQSTELGPDGKWPRVPDRSFFIADLFGNAAYFDAAQMLEDGFSDVQVQGIQTEASRVLERDLYCCSPPYWEDFPDMVQTALDRGASAIILPKEAEHHPDLQGLIPAEVPVLWSPNVEEQCARLGVAFYKAPSRDLFTVAVTGSTGKTTVAWLVRGILEEVEQVTGMVGSIEYALAEDRLDEDGDLWEPLEEDPAAGRECSAPFRVTPYKGKYFVESTTPSGLNLQKLLGGMRDRGAQCVVVETQAEALAAGHCSWLNSDVVIHTNIDMTVKARSGAGGQQERGKGGVEDQKELVEAILKPFEDLSDPSSQGAVINLDDPVSTLAMEMCGNVPYVTYAIDNQDADVVAESVKGDIWESETIIRTPLGRLQIITSLLGKHNTYNILAAVATGICLKVPLKSIVAGIEAVEVIPGRCEVVDEGQDFSVIIDAADTPKALEAMLSGLKANAKNVITVFGCRGDEDGSHRPFMAEVAHHLSDLVIITNDSPCTEPPEHIVQDIVAGLPSTLVDRYSGYVYFPFQDQGHVPLWFEPYLQKAQRTTKRYVMEDRFSAIRAAIGTAQAGDVVVITGRGDKDYMEYEAEEGGTVKGWFDDRAEVRSALSKLAYLNQLTGLNRSHLPWGKALDEMDTLIDPPIDRRSEEAAAAAAAAAAAPAQH